VNKKQKNIYLNALEFGEKLLNKGETVTFNKLQEHLKKRGYVFETQAEEQLLRDLAREAFHIYVSDGDKWKEEPSYLNVEGYFKLLEYRELNEARKSSREARRYAIFAIVLSIFTLVVSIYFSYKELNNETIINSKQFEVIENIWRSLK